eukprot:COSAG02_NODE_82_length_39723_cov_247.146650_11_plen_181_part_00
MSPLTTWEYHDESNGVVDDGEDDGYEEAAGEGYLPIGPLSLYFPDGLVRALMAQKPSMDISFIEAEQALLHAEGDVDDAMLHVRKQRESRARRRKEGRKDEFGHRELFERAAAAAGAGETDTSNMGQRMMRWITAIASSAVLVLVVISLLIVAMVDGVIEVPQMVKDVARDIADSRRRGP